MYIDPLHIPEYPLYIGAFEYPLYIDHYEQSRKLDDATVHKICLAYFLASGGWSGVGVGVSRSRLEALAALGGRAAAAAADADSLCSIGCALHQCQNAILMQQCQNES